MAFVKRHRAGAETPEVLHPDPDPRALALCERLAEHAAVQAVILGGSRHTGGWDEQSDLDLVAVLAEPRDPEAAERTVCLALADLRERHYPGYRNWNSKDNGVAEGQWIVAMEFFLAHRRTVNHAMALAARQGRIIVSEPGSEEKYRHDGDTSNEWELVTLPKLRNAWSQYRQIPIIRRIFDDLPPSRLNVRTEQGRTAHRLLWHSGSAVLSMLGIMYSNGSLAAMAETLREKDPGWTHEFASDLDCLDQYNGCGCEVVVARPIGDLEALWGALEEDREALWRRIEELSGYDLKERWQKGITGRFLGKRGPLGPAWARVPPATPTVEGRQQGPDLPTLMTPRRCKRAGAPLRLTERRTAEGRAQGQAPPGETFITERKGT